MLDVMTWKRRLNVITSNILFILKNPTHPNSEKMAFILRGPLFLRTHGQILQILTHLSNDANLSVLVGINS
jgi:hypothetical protein